MYWAQALAEQDDDAELKQQFSPLAKTLAENEQKILDELSAVQGAAVDIGGYYHADMEKMKAVMRPSSTFNEALDSMPV